LKVGRFQVMSLLQAARAYAKKFDRETLLSGSDFYADVYSPERDEWSERWSLETGANDE